MNLNETKTRINYNNIIYKSFIDSLKSLNPFTLIKNHTLFLFELCSFIMFFLCIKPDIYNNNIFTREVNLFISIILITTVFISNFIASATRNYTKSQAENLRVVHGDIEVKRLLNNGLIEYVFTSELKKNDIIKLQEGDLIPVDGEVIEGVATIDESAITGESSPVLKEPGTDTSSSVTGGTRVLTDSLLIKVTSEQGHTYLDQMINITENTETQKTTNKYETNMHFIGSIVLLTLSLILFPTIAKHYKLDYEINYIIALFVCLLPLTMESLSLPIQISGFNKISKLNILAMSEKALEIASKINIVYLDKTGTITFGNRMATELVPLGTHSITDVVKAAYICSYYDQTPEGKSIVTLTKRYGVEVDIGEIKGIPHEFTAHTRMSGIDLENGDILRKGACDAIKKLVTSKGGKIWENTDQLIESIAIQGGTPLLISKNNQIIGLIHLKDIVKISLKDRFKELKKLGVKTIMCTGDNNLTAKVITTESGIDEYIAQAKPQDKISLIRENQAHGNVVAMIGDGTNDAPAIAQSDIGLAMNSGTIAAKEAANLIDLDSNPAKIIDIIKIGREIAITKNAINAFSITSNIAKCLILISGTSLNFLHLSSSVTTLTSVLMFNSLGLLIMAPIAVNGMSSKKINLPIFTLTGLIVPPIGIKLIDLIISKFIIV